MKSQYRIFVIAFALFMAACNSSASQKPPTLSREHPMLGMLEEQPDPESLTAETLLTARWQFPLTLAKTKKAITVGDCEALLSAHEDDYGPRQPSEFGLIQANLALCQATADSQQLEPYLVNYLPEPLLSDDFTKVAPPELAVAISGSDQETVKQSKTWEEVSAVREQRITSPYEATYVSENGAIQRVFLLASGDFNGDGIRDAILYLESALEQGSYATARYVIITREAPDAPITVLKSGWPGQ